MKKILFVFVLTILVISLTSCQVNWFGETADVPWYYIAIPIALISVVGYYILMSRTYICPECGEEVDLSEIYEANAAEITEIVFTIK